MKAIFDRISIRKYEDKTVEQEKIEQILRAAMVAPSAGDQRPWEFYVVTDKEKIQALAKVSPYAGCAAKAPVVIVPCYRTEGLWCPEYDMIDTSIATQNILLEVTELGLGAVWLGVAPIEERMKATEAILGIESGLRAFAIVPVGYPAEGWAQEDRYEEARVHYL